MLILMNWYLSFMFIFTSHPLSMGSILFLQTILVSVSSGLMHLNFWFSYIIFLIMIGGMLVMFMYMTSIASNEKFSHPNMFMYTISLIFVGFWLMTMLLDSFLSMELLKSFNFIKQPLILHTDFTLSKFFNKPSMNLMIFLTVYLLITLIAIVKITDNYKGTLRQK
uniref:NADH-ubiquinone oxidoreductase chain 6 n=1 Tax=Curculionoidea sp. 20 KM-2017 TaxID=2219404 RepID=A0A346RIR1_9CUCU|nr:NADH dehydrogenase subunit 6 [Curculionoidea sp. 20 KM-2017]